MDFPEYLILAQLASHSWANWFANGGVVQLIKIPLFNLKIKHIPRNLRILNINIMLKHELNATFFIAWDVFGDYVFFVGWFASFLNHLVNIRIINVLIYYNIEIFQLFEFFIFL